MLIRQLDEIVYYIACIVNQYVYYPSNMFLSNINATCLQLHEKTKYYHTIEYNYPNSIPSLSKKGLKKCRDALIDIVSNAGVSPITREHYIQLSYLCSLFYENVSSIEVKDKLREYYIKYESKHKRFYQARSTAPSAI